MTTIIIFPQVLDQLVILAWLAMVDIMDKGFNKLYNLEMMDELELIIWLCLLAIQSQSSTRIPPTTELERREVQEAL